MKWLLDASQVLLLLLTIALVTDTLGNRIPVVDSFLELATRAELPSAGSGTTSPINPAPAQPGQPEPSQPAVTPEPFAPPATPAPAPAQEFAPNGEPKYTAPLRGGKTATANLDYLLN